MKETFAMAEETRRRPVIRIWAPAPDVNSAAYTHMKHLADYLDALEQILGDNGVTAADIMPPLARGRFDPNKDLQIQYEIFAAPSTLQIGVGSEFERIDKGINETFGLVGALCRSMAPDIVRKAHIEHHGLSLLASRNLPEKERG